MTFRGPEAPTPPLALLDAAGNAVHSDETAPLWDIVEGLDDATLLGMHREMVVTRAFDIESGNLQRQGQLGLWVPSLGQEGGQVGIAFAMRDQDTVFPSYREHLIAHVRGVRFEQIIDIFRGAVHGGWNPAQTRGCRLYSLVIGTQALHAAGFARGIQLDGTVGTGDATRDEAVVVCYGDGASSQGDASEGLVFAASSGAPLVMFVQNNRWAISVPAEVQFRTPLHERARGFGVPSAHIDGNDPLVSFAVARIGLDVARAGEGPRYIQADTYRIGAHTTSDDPTRYREGAELDEWTAKDPIVRYEAFLRRRGVADAVLQEHADEGAQAAADIRAWVLSAPDVPSDDIFDFVYREPHAALTAQKRWLADYEQSFGED